MFLFTPPLFFLSCLLWHVHRVLETTGCSVFLSDVELVLTRGLTASSLSFLRIYFFGWSIFAFFDGSARGMHYLVHSTKPITLSCFTTPNRYKPRGLLHQPSRHCFGSPGNDSTRLNSIYDHIDGMISMGLVSAHLFSLVENCKPVMSCWGSNL